MSRALLASSAGYSLKTDPVVLEAWVAKLAGFSPGAVSSWTGLKGTVCPITGTTRSYSTTAITNDEGATFPGVVFGSAIMTCPIGPKLAGKTRIVEIIAWQNTQSALMVPSEGGSAYSAAGNGHMGILGNVATANGYDLYTAAKGGNGVGSLDSPLHVITPDPQVITVVWDLSSAPYGVTSIRIDNVEIISQCVTGADGAHLVAGSTFANEDNHFGARQGGTFPFSGPLAARCFLDNPNETKITQVTQLFATYVGQVAA